MSTTSSLSDRHVALVTGGGSGIGAAVCRRLGASGTAVVVADIDEDAANRVADEIDGLALSLDVAERDAWAGAVASVIETYGRLDQLALNAGTMIRPRGVPIFDDPIPWTTERYELVRGVNIDGVVYGVMAALPHLESTSGKIVCTASTAGLKPLTIDPIYSMTKHAVVGLVRSLAAPLAERGVTVTAVCPGGVDTPIVAPDIRASAHMFATPDHIAEAIEMAMHSSIEDTGAIWVSTHDSPPWQYEYLDLV